MGEFVGKWKLVFAENMDAYLEALGVDPQAAKASSSTPPVITISENGGEWSVKTQYGENAMEIKFKLGVEFEETIGDGKKVKSTVTKSENKLVHVRKGDNEITLVREVNGNDMKVVTTLGSVVCTRNYKRE